MKIYDLINNENGLSRLFLDIGAQFFLRRLKAGEKMEFDSPNETFGPSPTFSVLVEGELSVHSVFAEETTLVRNGPGRVLENYYPGPYEITATEDSLYVCVSPAPKGLLERGMVAKLATVEGRTLIGSGSMSVSPTEQYRAAVVLHGSCQIKGREVVPGEIFLFEEGEQIDVTNLSYCEIAFCR